MHKKGLQFGIYEDYGNYTCGGYPGILGHLKTDADTFAEWGVDYVKLDGCYADPKDMDQGGCTNFGLWNGAIRSCVDFHVAKFIKYLRIDFKIYRLSTTTLHG